MEQADLALEREHWEAASAWTAHAAELRQQPEPAGARLTLHDVEARTCPHDMIVIRDTRASTSWWMHVANHTMCTDTP